MKRGYFYIRSSIRQDSNGLCLLYTKKFISEYCGDKVYYDLYNKEDPSNRKFLNIVINSSKANDVIVIPSILHLGTTVKTIMKWLTMIKTRKIRLMIKDYEVNVSKILIELEGCSNNKIMKLDDKISEQANLEEQEKNLFRRAVGYDDG